MHSKSPADASGGDGPEFEGRYSDGRTAASHVVHVRIGARDVIIDPGQGAASLVWPLSAIETAEPLTSSAIDVLIHEPGRAGATVFVAEGAFVRQLAARAPRLTARVQRWRYAAPWIAVTAGTAAVAAIIAFVDVSPARSIAKLLPDQTRSALGRQVIQSMSSGRGACSEGAGLAALGSLAKRLSAASGSTKTFEVSVNDNAVVNAFAAPGEQIVIMRGLLEKAESADEVAGVLAHEMGHGLELHPETGIVRAVGLIAVTEFILGGSGGTIANIGLYLTQLSYGRQAEREADGHALRILKKAGISTRGISDFFRRMNKDDRVSTGGKPGTAKPSSAFDILSSHPSSAERLERIEAAPSYPSTPALTADEWRSLKRICGGAAQAPARKSPEARPAPGQGSGSAKKPPSDPGLPRPPGPVGETPRDI